MERERLLFALAGPLEATRIFCSDLAVKLFLAAFGFYFLLMCPELLLLLLLFYLLDLRVVRLLRRDVVAHAFHPIR